jgi:dienelactone hydrolase
MKRLAAIAILALGAAEPRAELVTREIEYRDGDVVLEGYIAYPKDTKGKLPGVLVCHQWMGHSEYERRRVEETARLGTVALALDIYGKGVRPKDAAEAAKTAGAYKADRALLRTRALAGLEALRKLEVCDPSKIAVMGYCFGGTTALEVARSGAEVLGTVSFHGDLSSPSPEDAKHIKGKVLALHGADDPFVPAKDVAAFEDEMRQAKVDWQIVKYGGAVHSFTDWNAGDNHLEGAAYNEKADRRSWDDMKQFFAEIFR